MLVHKWSPPPVLAVFDDLFIVTFLLPSVFHPYAILSSLQSLALHQSGVPNSQSHAVMFLIKTLFPVLLICCTQVSVFPILSELPSWFTRWVTC